MKKELVKQEVLLVFHKDGPGPMRDQLSVKTPYVERVSDVVAVFKRSGYKLTFKEIRETFERVTRK